MTILDLTASVDLDAQEMYKDLMDDIIQATGTDFYYIPKEDIDQDVLLREDIHKVYKNYYVIEGYIKNKDEYQHSLNVQTKYGTDYREYLVLCLTRRRFHEVLPSNFIRPRTGDLIYSPVFNGLFRINYTEHELPFYQLQHLTFYELYLERYVYNNDTLETGIERVDSIQYNYGYKIVVTYVDMQGQFIVGDKIDQVFNGATITGKIAHIDQSNNKIVITDIISNDEISLNFVISDTYLVYDINDNSKYFEISELYDITDNLNDLYGDIFPISTNSTVNNIGSQSGFNILSQSGDNLQSNGTNEAIYNTNNRQPNIRQGINDELKQDVNDYIEPIPDNPFWGD